MKNVILICDYGELFYFSGWVTIEESNSIFNGRIKFELFYIYICIERWEEWKIEKKKKCNKKW